MSRTADESRALGLFVDKHPRLRDSVVSGGWDALSPSQQDEARALFLQWWGREPDIGDGGPVPR